MTELIYCSSKATRDEIFLDQNGIIISQYNEAFVKGQVSTYAITVK